MIITTLRRNIEMDSIPAQLIEELNHILNTEIVASESPKQGADNIVFFITTSENNSFSVKLGDDVNNDILVSDLVTSSNTQAKIPKKIASFSFDKKLGIIQEKITSPLLRYILPQYKKRFIHPIMTELSQFHHITHETAGIISDVLKEGGPKYVWKEYLLHKYSNNHPWFPWEEIAHRPNVNQALLTKALEYIKIKIETEVPNLEMNSLLHTDLNQGNVFVDITSSTVTALIDWSEAVFGDPLYDFARFRMNLWHRQGIEEIQLYYDFLKLTPEEKETEEIYFINHLIDYINWFSESQDMKRMKLHEEYLQKVINS